MLNTMVPGEVPTTAAMLADPVRRYMLPVASDRLPGTAASHPYAARDSLHEHEMWAVEGLTHRYPTKVLAEDRKSTRLNSSHANISYAVFCLKKKKNHRVHCRSDQD